ncbi:hypothetical protein PIB30_000498 [Stylosanthes scabra]|uniref:Secreted protein n=1 Tax=Stylosanthes scabra TaxID=79078 RepID=A0ABU6W211_9FABA|nr:hypothetical protein [Stylosanthes scabra]
MILSVLTLAAILILPLSSFRLNPPLLLCLSLPVRPSLFSFTHSSSLSSSSLISLFFTAARRSSQSSPLKKPFTAQQKARNSSPFNT